MPIIAKKTLVIHKNGHRNDYTHVTYIGTEPDILIIEGETNEREPYKGMRVNVIDKHIINDIHLMIVEFYKPKI